MKNKEQNLHVEIGTQLKKQGLDLLEFAKIPNSSNRMAVIRTLQEAVDRFENDQGTTSYILHMRPAKAPKTDLPERSTRSATSSHEPVVSIYREDGKLNLSYLFKNADLLRAAGEFKNARHIYKTIFLSGEGTGRALFGLACCFEAENRLKEAEAAFEEAIAYDPSLLALQKLAEVLVRLNRDHYAAEIIERALRLNGTAPEVRLDLHKAAGNCYQRLNLQDRAVAHYQSALRIDYNADNIQSNLGSLYLKDGRLEEAKKAFLDATASNPKNHRAWVGLGSVYLTVGDKADAYQAFLNGLRIDGRNATALFYLVKCAYALKKFSEAEIILANYVAQAPVNANLLYSLAGMQYHQKKDREALSTIRKIIQIKPDHQGARDLEGRIRSRFS